MANNLDVRITADVADLQQKFAIAKAEASALGSEMAKLAKDSAAGVGPIDQGKFAALAENLVHARAEASSYGAQIKASAEETVGFGTAIEEARGHLSTPFQVTGAAAAIEAVRGMAEAIQGMGERATEIRSMSEVLGVTQAQFQAMGAAAEEAGVDSKQFFIASERLNNNLREARDASGPAIANLRQLGLTAPADKRPEHDADHGARHHSHAPERFGDGGG